MQKRLAPQPSLIEIFTKCQNYIAENPELTYERAIQVFKNVRKTQSVIKGAAIIKDLYWTEYRDKIKEDLSILEELPGIGPASTRQIARNIGYDTVKPDTHIKKVAAYFDVDPDMMCKTISESIDLPVHTIDSIFWKCGVEGKLREWLR